MIDSLAIKHPKPAFKLDDRKTMLNLGKLFVSKHQFHYCFHIICCQHFKPLYMKFKTLYQTGILASAIFTSSLSCSLKNNTASPTIFKQTKLDSAYTSIRPTIQLFKIDNNRPNKIVAANGTEVLVPAECFTKPNGDKVREVQIEIVEAFSLSDFISSGLTTLSNGQLLMSNGMIFLNAKSGNENLQLINGTSLTVSMPTMTDNRGFQLFSGNGENWNLDTSMTKTDYSIPLPLALLYPEGNKQFLYCITQWRDIENYYYYDTTILNITNKRYENTVIATEEFNERISTLTSMMHMMSFFTNRNYYLGSEDCKDEKFNYDIWKIYFDHPERPLRESDSIAKLTYINYFNQNKKKLAAFCEEVNSYNRERYSNWTDTNYYFDFRKISLEDYFMIPIQTFPSANTKDIKLINSHGIDPTAPDAFEQLLAKGIGKEEINQILNYSFRRQAKIKELQKKKDNLLSKEKIEQMYESTIFSVTQMGWINCDRFYKDPTAGKAIISVSNGSDNKIDYIDCSLVIPEMNVRLSAYPNGADGWTFTKKDGPYTRLPLGQNAVITGIALHQDSVFFASKKIKITDGLSVALPMKKINKSSLKDSLINSLKY